MPFCDIERKSRSARSYLKMNNLKLLKFFRISSPHVRLMLHWYSYPTRRRTSPCPERNETLRTHGSLIPLTSVRFVLFPRQTNAFYDTFHVPSASRNTSSFPVHAGSTRDIALPADFVVPMVSWFRDIPNCQKKNGPTISIAFLPSA